MAGRLALGSSRIEEAEMNRWPGELQGLEISLEAARARLTAMNRASQTNLANIVELGIPVIGDRK